MFLVLIGATVTVILTGLLFSWPQPYFKWKDLFGWAITWSLIMAVIVMIVGGIFTNFHSLYTVTVSESALRSTGGDSFVLVNDNHGVYVWKTDDGPNAVYQSDAEIIPSDDTKVVKTEFDTTKWALWPKSPQFVLYVPAGGAEGLTEAE